MDDGDFELVEVDSLPICMGNPPIRKVEKGFPEKIHSLGVGRTTGDNASLRFSLPIRYAGEMDIDGNTYDLFRIPDEGVSGRDLFNADSPLYLMMAVCGSDESKWFLYRPKWHKTNTVKKVFNKEVTS